MFTGLWKLTWIETKVFLREPMGVFGSVGIPVVAFLLLGQAFGGMGAGSPFAAGEDPPFNIAILAALFIAVGAVLSLTTIIAIYREGGILKRLRATPLSPLTILGAHVVVKLGFTLVTLGLLVAVGRRFLPGAVDVPLAAFSLALLLSTASILSLGFVMASVVPTARFAQPVGAAVLYPMVAISGLFFPLELLPGPLETFARVLPTTQSVSLMNAVWEGAPRLEVLTHAIALVAIALTLCGIATRVFRWE